MVLKETKYVMILKDIVLCVISKSTCAIEETLMARLENGVERKKIVYFLL